MRLLRLCLVESLGAIALALVLITISSSIIGVDVARTLLGPKPTEEEVQALHHQLGLDRPLLERVVNQVWRALHGDLGASYVFRQPVASLLFKAVSHSLRLIIPALLIGGLSGPFIGIWVAYRPTKRHHLMLAALTGLALVPTLVLSTLVVFGIGYKLGWLPPPLITAVTLLALGPLSLMALTACNEYSRILESDYIRAARSLGVTEWKIASQFILKAAGVALVSNMTTLTLYLLTATMFIEITFVLPGLGQLLLTATERLDYPIVVGISLLIVVSYGVMNAFSGIALYVLDPRTR
jgi:peptide/nickel transport system permease protein